MELKKRASQSQPFMFEIDVHSYWLPSRNENRHFCNIQKSYFNHIGETFGFNFVLTVLLRNFSVLCCSISLICVLSHAKVLYFSACV